MKRYVVFIRGINVGGMSKVSMPVLRELLEAAGYRNVVTYINSGNVILSSAEDEKTLKSSIERILSDSFSLAANSGSVHVLSAEQLTALVREKPSGFGEDPSTFHSDAIFLMGIDVDQAFSVFSPKEGVDTIWKGDGVIYSQRLSEHRTKSRLNRIMSSPLYKRMTIRTWQTTLKLLELAHTE